MSQRAEIVRPAEPASLAALLCFIDEACQRADLDAEAAFSVRLAAEEACTNVITHAYAGTEPGPVTLGFERLGQSVTVTVADEAPPFDPSRASAPDLESGWEERAIGGLGLHLIRQMMDEVHHEAGPECGNRLTMVKHLSA